MEVPDNLLCLFNGELEKKNGNYVIEIPKREISNDQIQPGNVYRAVILQNRDGSTEQQVRQSEYRKTEKPALEPPVKEGEKRTVEIEDIGDRGDGIARVERGYVIIVPETEPGDEPLIEIQSVRENVAFGAVVNQQG